MKFKEMKVYFRVGVIIYIIINYDSRVIFQKNHYKPKANTGLVTNLSKSFQHAVILTTFTNNGRPELELCVPLML